MKSTPFAFLVPCVLATVARAEDVRIEMRVTSAAGSAVYVDRGSASGLVEGDVITFRGDGGALATGVVRSVTANGARVEIGGGSERPAIGARGEAIVPDSRAGASSDDARADHPPWTQPIEGWDASRPLLAPAFGLAPEDREPRVHGRAWLRFDGSRDAGLGRTYALTAVGADATLENPFGDGGALRVDAEAYARMGVDERDDDARVRLDRLSYVVGGTEDRPDRFLVGRFLQSGVPEFGLLDGAEWNHRTRGGSEYGASFGWMPEPFADRTSFDDVQASVHYRHAFDVERRALVGVAYQNTWHDGEQDRNLFVAEAEARPSDRWTLRATAWIDLYDARDEIKGSGAELTEARVAATWTIAPGSGASAYALQRRIPELLRDEFAARRADDVRDEVVDRVGISAWTDVSTRWRLDARVERWSDQDDDGIDGEIGATWSEPFGASSSISAALAWADGSFSSGPGARVQARDTYGSTSVGLGWQSFWYAQDDFGGDDGEIAQHTIFASADVPLSDRWDLALLVDRTLGDDVDAWTAGFVVQTRF